MGGVSQSEQECLEVTIRREPEALDLPLPAYATAGAVGMDLYAVLPTERPFTLPPGERTLISTGIRIGLPSGYEAQVRPRSGLAWKHGIGMVNAPGTIDADYTGVVQVLLINWSREPFTIRRGDRIAQLVVAPVTRVIWHEAERLESTLRGESGFGSTGFTLNFEENV